MPQPIAYNSGNPISGSIEKSTLSFTVEGAPRDERDYSSSYAGVDWYSTIPPQDGKYVIISASNPPMIWVTADETDAELLTTINGLPDRYNQTLFTDTGSALSWLGSNAYFVSRETPDQIDADSMVLNLDAGLESSYPREGTTLYDLSGFSNDGVIYNSPTFNSKGYFELDGVDDNIRTGTSVNSYSGSIEIIATRENSTANTFPINSVSYPGTNRYYIRQNMGLSDWDVVRGNPLSAAGLGSIDIGKFYHIVMTWDSNTVYGWKNGELMNTASYTNPGTPTTFISIGAANSSGVNAVQSNIASVKTYDKTLSSDEIKQNYYGGPIVTDGLVLAVDAGNLVSYESGSTTTYPLTGSVNGTLTNGVKYNSNNGGHWEFDGVDDYITWGDNFDLVSSNISGFVWGKVNTLADYTPWIDKLSSFGNYRFHSDAAGRLVLGIRDSSNTYQETTTTSVLSIDTWYNIGFTFNNSTREGKIYLNGNLIHSNTFTIDRGNTVTALQTGYQANNGGTLNGAVATLSLYNKALTAEEVAQNYSATKQKYLF